VGLFFKEEMEVAKGRDIIGEGVSRAKKVDFKPSASGESFLN